MKNLKVILFAVVFAVSNVLVASTNPTKADKPTSITEQVSKLLANPGFEVENDVDADVTLMINDAQELVVLNVTTEDEAVANFIKSRLNYQKVEQVSGENSFVVPVRVVPGE